MCVWFCVRGGDCVLRSCSWPPSIPPVWATQKNLGWWGPFSHDHIPPPWTFCQFSLQNLGSTNKTWVQQCGKEHSSPYNGCGGPVPRQQSSVSRCGAEALGEKMNGLALLCWKQPERELFWNSFPRAWLMHLSVGVIGAMAHEQTHSHVSQSTVALWILQFWRGMIARLQVRGGKK